MALPGDEILPVPMLEATHAITLNADADQIWPWLIQIGQGRAGFYSDTLPAESRRQRLRLPARREPSTAGAMESP